MKYQIIDNNSGEPVNDTTYGTYSEALNRLFDVIADDCSYNGIECNNENYEKYKENYTIEEVIYLKELKEQLEKYGLTNMLGMIKEVEFRLGAIKYIREIFNNNFKDYSEKNIQLLIEENYWIFGEEYNIMIGSEEDDFNKLRNVYCNKVLNQKNEEPNNLSKRQVDLFICANTENHFESRKHLIVEIKKPNHYLKTEDYRQIEDYREEIYKIPQFKSDNKHSWNFILLYREISKEHMNYFNKKIKNNLTGETVDSTDFFKIFIVRWDDLLIDCEHRMNYLKKRLEDKKKHMLRIKKEEEYQKSPMSKFIGQTNEEN